MKTILVLEDEPALRDLLQDVLTEQGYDVLEAASPEEALGQVCDTGRQVDLLIADVSMPGGSGVQAASLLRSKIPGLRVILTSGYPPDAWSARDAIQLLRLGVNSVSILLKPFSAGTLLNRISGLIGARQPEVLKAGIS